MDYEIVHAAGTTPFLNECSGGAYVAVEGEWRIIMTLWGKSDMSRGDKSDFEWLVVSD